MPLNRPRTTTTDVNIQGFAIKKGTMVVPQISAVLSNEKLYPKANEFDPSRFLEEDGVTLKKAEELVPFSVGKRACLGESLARMELFMIFANFMRKFTVSKVPFKPVPTLEPKERNFAVHPVDYACFIEERE